MRPVPQHSSADWKARNGWKKTQSRKNWKDGAGGVEARTTRFDNCPRCKTFKMDTRTTHIATKEKTMEIGRLYDNPLSASHLTATSHSSLSNPESGSRHKKIDL